MSSAETTAADENTGAAPSRRLRRVLIGLGVLVLVLALVVGGALWFVTNRYAGNIDRVSDVFADLDEGSRPAPATPAQQAAEKPVTFLLVGRTPGRPPRRGLLPAAGRTPS